MTIAACLQASAARGHITQADANAWEARYTGLIRAGRSAAQAREQVIQEMERLLVHERRRGFLADLAQQDRERDMLAHRDARGNANAAEAFKLLHSAESGQARLKDVKHLTGAIFRQWLGEMDELIYEFRKGWLTGDRRRQGNWVGSPEVRLREANLVREAFGEDTGDPIAKRMAAAVVAGNEALRQRFNYAGGAIGQRQRYGLPTSHNPEAVRRVARDEWIAFIEPLLDPARMRHPLTGQPMTAADLRAALEHVYETIRTEGWNTREPSMLPEGAGALYSRRADHRFLEFKDGAAWLTYQKAFGHPDVFSMIIGHGYSMAKDIAAMELFGPNPTAMRNYLKQVVERATAGDVAASAGARLELFRADEMWDYLRGTTHTPVHTFWANTFANIRNVITSATLGAASISSLSDFGTHALRRRFNGLPSARLLQEVVTQLGPQTKADMARYGLILDEVLSTIDQQARFVGAVTGSQWSKFLVDRVLTFNGLSPLTGAQKRAFGLSIQGDLAARADTAWGQLPAPHRNMLERAGFGAASWDDLRGANLGGNARAQLLYSPAPGTGATFLRPREVSQLVSQDLAERYLIMIERETTFAVPEVTTSSASLFIGTTRPGTFAGEILRSGLQFKGFPIAFLTLHLGQVFRDIMGGHGARGAAYGGALLIVMTLFGALAMSLKDLFNGRDPRDAAKLPLLTKEGNAYWGAALLQGGGLGIWGDFLFADVNRFGGGITRTLAGPLADRVDNLRNLTIGNVLQAGQGEKTNFGREAVRFLRQNTPGGTLFYTRLAWERTVLDQLQFLADPEAHRAFHAARRRRRRDYGQEFWWAPGESSPARAPDLSRALGSR